MIIKSFKMFGSKFSIESICSDIGLKDFTVNGDGSIDVNSGDVIIDGPHLNKDRKIPLKFRNVFEDFVCAYANLSSLEGCPETVGGSFTCSHNNLLTLEYGPRKVQSGFRCNGNQLTSLKGCPERVGGGLDFSNNNILSFRGLPEFIGGYIYCVNNPIDQIYRLHSVKEFAELINEYDVIREGNKVVETRLRQALEDSNCKKIPDQFKFKNYELI